MNDKFNKNLSSVLSFFPRLFKAVFGSKSEKVKNKHLFKRGGYAIAIIALVIAVSIILNVLVGLLANRVTLEFDMTTDKKNSISADNAEYLKTVNRDVKIYVLAPDAESYHSGGMAQAAQTNMFYANTSDYYFQTTVLLEQYEKLNNKIDIEYIDPNGTEVGAIVSKYGVNYTYGDIIVTCDFEEDGNKFENKRSLTLVDVYTYEENTEYAAMGITMYEINGSCLETNLTSAIATVTSTQTLNVGVITSHSSSGIYDYYTKLLKMNNFEVTEITDTLITSISSDFDVVVLAAPNKDFATEELTAISKYLENDGQLGKNFVFYGDSSYQSLPNLYNFLAEWGITVESGIVFETSDSFRGTDYSTYISLSATNDLNFLDAGSYYASGYNIAMRETGSGYAGRETQTLLTTNGTSVIMPIDSDNTVAPNSDAEKRKLASCILSRESEFVDNVAVESNLIAFSSVDFINETYALSYGSVMDYDSLNVDLLRSVTGSDKAEIVFDVKTIEETSELYVVSSASAKVMRVIFAAVIPVAILVLAFVIFFRRRNK
ncbi:MAG: GldG family protein [Acutalibacteraceae bacterium]|nr:GldG family protein [Acutalibacteraceae bacterium]